MGRDIPAAAMEKAILAVTMEKVIPAAVMGKDIPARAAAAVAVEQLLRLQGEM